MDDDMTQHDESDAVQRAISTRLARLNTIPVDTSRLDQLLRDQISMPRKHRPFLVFGWLAGAGAVACAALIIAAALLFTGPPRLSAAELAGVYQNLAVQPGVMLTGAQANSPVQMAPGMVCMLKSGQIASCCRQTVGKYRLACVAVKSPSRASVVMVAGNAGKVNCPQGQAVTIAGHSYSLVVSGHINMLMRRVGKRWYCAMGSEKPGSLAQYLGQIAPTKR